MITLFPSRQSCATCACAIKKQSSPVRVSPPPPAVPRHVYLVDGSGFIFRAYHALPPLTRSDGTPIAAVLGFSNMLAKLLQETDADHIAVIFDAAGTSFRNRLYDQYKANRGAPPDVFGFGVTIATPALTRSFQSRMPFGFPLRTRNTMVEV